MKNRSVNTWRRARSVSQFALTGNSERRSSELMIFMACLCNVSSTSVCADVRPNWTCMFKYRAQNCTVEAQQVFDITNDPHRSQQQSNLGRLDVSLMSYH